MVNARSQMIEPGNNRNKIAIFAVIYLFNTVATWAAAMPTPAVDLDPAAPRLQGVGGGGQPTTEQRFQFAARSLRWAREQGKGSADDKSRAVDWQLMENIAVLKSIPDSEDDKAEKDQSDARDNAAWNAVKALLEEGPEAAVKSLAKTALAPTIVGDGQGPTRDALIAWSEGLLAQRLINETSQDLGAATTSLKKTYEKYKDNPTTKDEIRSSTGAGTDWNAVYTQFIDAERVRQNLQAEDASIIASKEADAKDHAAMHFTPLGRPVPPFDRHYDPTEPTGPGPYIPPATSGSDQSAGTINVERLSDIPVFHSLPPPTQPSAPPQTINPTPAPQPPVEIRRN